MQRLRPIYGVLAITALEARDVICSTFRQTAANGFLPFRAICCNSAGNQSDASQTRRQRIRIRTRLAPTKNPLLRKQTRSSMTTTSHANSAGRKRVALLLPFFGTFPPWINLYFKTCSVQQDFQWLVFSDQETAAWAGKYPNITF